MTIQGDSQLIIYQMTGKYKCKDQKMIEIKKEIMKVIEENKIEIKFEWIEREKNKIADKLCNLI